ncbi:MAG: cupin-like domain-containing protein [Steroidobacteraceae bacterium]
MAGGPAKIPEWRNVDVKTFRGEIVPRDRPAVMRGLVGHWPAVHAGIRSPQALYDYIRPRDLGHATTTFIGPPDIRGGFFYSDDLSGMNFRRVPQAFHAAMESMLAHLDHLDPPAIYAPAASGLGFPDFARENTLELLDASVVPRLWLGNAVTAPTHYDMHDNVACMVAGHKRFTLFPPDQLANLYVGPLDLSPGGQPTSLVRLANPDLQRFPRFAQALAAAETADLEPGDAIFIPNLWWHNVESLDPINLLVNYWWFGASRGAGSPYAALVMGLMSITELPESRREIWRTIFDHYVFQSNGDPVPYLPADRRGVLGPIDAALLAYMREGVIKSLVAPLSKEAAEHLWRRVTSGG